MIKKFIVLIILITCGKVLYNFGIDFMILNSTFYGLNVKYDMNIIYISSFITALCMVCLIYTAYRMLGGKSIFYCDLLK